MPGAPTTLMPLRERIEAATVAYRNQECLVLPDATLSFGEVDRLANATANALLDRGVREGSVVMTLCHNGAALVATWFACMKIGAVFAPLNASLSGDPLVHVITSAGGSVLVCDGSSRASRAPRCVRSHIHRSRWPPARGCHPGSRASMMPSPRPAPSRRHHRRLIPPHRRG